jgi:diguanylate cyclase (GGDEF)-like protein
MLQCVALLLTTNLATEAADAPALSVSHLARDVSPDATRDIISGTLDSAFETVPADRVTRTASAMWLKVKVGQSTGLVEPVLVLRQTRTARVTLFPPSGEPITQSLYGETPSPRFTRDAVYFALGGTSQPGDTYYLYIDQLRAGVVSLDLRAMAEVNAANLAHLRNISLVIGALLVMGITTLLMWVWLPDRGLLYLGASMALASVYVALLMGEGYAWANFSADSLVAFNVLQVVVSLGYGFSVLFFRELLDFGRFARRVSAMLKALAIFFFAESALLFAASGELLRLLTALGNIGILATWVLLVPAMVAASIRGSTVARFLFLAWLPTTIMSIPHALTYLRGEQEQAWILNGVLISTVIGFVLKSCALGARLRMRRAGRAFVAFEAPQDDFDSILRRLRTACEHAGVVGPTSVIKVQIDGARRLAAAHGEAILPKCMAKIRARIRRALRDDDALGAAGDAGLFVVISGADANAAAATAERIRRRVNEGPINFDGISLPITVSVGLTYAQGSAQATIDADSLIAQAEAAAVTADTAGGNRVVYLPA